MISNKLGAVALAAALLGTASAVSAASVDRPAQVSTLRVRYADLNLGNDAGVRRLYERLRWAATQVCTYPTAFGLIDKGCIKRALQDAVNGIDNTALPALHSRSGVAEVVASRD